MTVTASSRVSQYTGNGVTTTFAVDFQFFEIAVYVENELIDDTLYTITQDEPGLDGSVTFLEAPASGAKIKIIGATDVKQDIDYVENDGFPAESHERALDRITMALLDFKRDLGQIDPTANLEFPDHLVKINEDGEFVALQPSTTGYIWVNEDGEVEVVPQSDVTPQTTASISELVSQSFRSLLLKIGDPVLSMAPSPAAGRIRLTESNQSLAKSAWPELSAWLASLSTPYPFGSTTTHFTLPSAAGYYLRFAATSSSIDTSGARLAGSKQTDQNKSHTHDFSGTTGQQTQNLDHTHTLSSTGTAGGSGTQVLVPGASNATGGNNSTLNHTHPFSGTTSGNGTNAGDEVRVKNVAFHLDIVASSALSGSALGMFGYSYSWDTGTSSPGLAAGKVRVNNASLGSVTAIYAHATDGWGVDLTAIYNSLQVGQVFRLSKIGAQNNTLIARITSTPSIASSIVTIPVEVKASNGSFVSLDTISLEASGLPGDLTAEASTLASAAAASATAAAASATAAASSATAAATSATNAATSATTATTQATAAAASATTATTQATTATTQASNASTSATAAATSATSASTSASTATTQASNASTSATAAAASAVAAASQAAALTGTSTTSLAIAVATKVFTTQAGKQWGVGSQLLITSDASPTANWMFGTVTGYSSTTLTVDVSVIGGSGTLSDWTIRLSGSRGPAGSAGSGAGGNASYITNLTLAASVSGSALTIAVKVADGTTNPSAGDPINVTFRSATAAAGTYDSVQIAAALSLTISSGSTLGFANATAGRGWVVLINDAGTPRLGIVNCLTSLKILPLQESQLLSSTAEGGAGAADSAQVVYTGTAVTSKAFRVLGYFEYSSGLTTAGTYDIVPTKLQLYGPGVSLPGQTVQSAYAIKTDTFSTASTTAVDITGLTLAVTPTSACNLFNFRTSVVTGFDPSAGNGSYHWATRDSTVIAQGDAASSRTRVTSQVIPLYTSTMGALTMEVMDAPRTTSSVTYKSQIAATASTVYVNRSQSDTDAAGRARGTSSLTITEIQA